MTVRLKSENAKHVANKYRNMARRLERLDGASEELHRAWIDGQRRRLEVQPLGRNQNLGPSVVEPTHPQHVFYVTSDGRIAAGTEVPYATEYETRTGNVVVELDSETERLLSEAIVKYVRLR